MDEAKDRYVYKLLYPESMGGAVFYIGKGQGKRIDQHEKDAKRGEQSLKSNIIRSIWDAGEQVVKQFIAKDLSENDALRLEMEIINRYELDRLVNRHMKGTYKSLTPEWRTKHGQDIKERCAKRSEAQKSITPLHLPDFDAGIRRTTETLEWVSYGGRNIRVLVFPDHFEVIVDGKIKLRAKEILPLEDDFIREHSYASVVSRIDLVALTKEQEDKLVAMKNKLCRSVR
jgi:hypothetical protein